MKISEVLDHLIGIQEQCQYCGVYPGQYHHPDYENWNKSDNQKKGQE